ncbi:MAG TPA: acyl-CoA dehydrogenase family protein, partial [Actinomycetes bacterium]
MTDPPTRAFALTAAQERLQSEVRALAREVLAPLAGTGQPGRVNRPLVRALGEHGLLARVLPSAPGAPGAEPPAPPAGGAVALCLLREALARESTEAETAL